MPILTIMSDAHDDNVACILIPSATRYLKHSDVIKRRRQGVKIRVLPNGAELALSLSTCGAGLEIKSILRSRGTCDVKDAFFTLSILSPAFNDLNPFKGMARGPFATGVA